MNKLKEIISLTWTYYNRGQLLSDAVLLMYAEDLADLDPQACIEAYGRYRRNPANRIFPLPAQIRELVNPEEFISHETKAREIASRIVGAIPKFGWANGKEAQVFIGAEGWAQVQRVGGWSYLCENVGASINPTTLQAQLRDQLEGTLKYGLPAVQRSLQVVSGGKSDELESSSDILRRLTSRDENTEPEPA